MSSVGKKLHKKRSFIKLLEKYVTPYSALQRRSTQQRIADLPPDGLRGAVQRRNQAKMK